MSRSQESGADGTGVAIRLARIRVDAEATINVDGVDVTTKIHPVVASGTDNRSIDGRSNLPAWLAASKVGSV